jgi:Spy/CpxP family protein refolding chaperone
MYPGMMYWWKQARQHAECGREWSERPGYGGHHGGFRAEPHDHGGGGFGVRRPLRFLAYKLGLSEPQVGELARILAELKTERAQGEVDDRRTVTAFADAVAGETFDQAKASEGAELRQKSAERLNQAVLSALARIHALLAADQRAQLAYLIRTGVVTL